MAADPAGGGAVASHGPRHRPRAPAWVPNNNPLEYLDSTVRTPYGGYHNYAGRLYKADALTPALAYPCESIHIGGEQRSNRCATPPSPDKDR